MVRPFKLAAACLALAFVASCSWGKLSRVLLTSEGIPRKIVIRADSTALYSSRKLDEVVATAGQWQIFFLLAEKKNSYVVSPTAEPVEQRYHVAKADAFEWNTFFSVAYRNSPRQAGRSPVVIYATEEGAKTGRGDTVMVEKPEHLVGYHDPKPVLQETERGIYHLAAMYDDVDSLGNYVSQGSYGFGFTRYDPSSHVILRYVSRDQLENHINILLGAQMKTKPSMSPSDMDGLFGPLRSLLADFGSDAEAGLNELLGVLESDAVPLSTRGGPFDPRHRSGDARGMNPELKRTAQRMIDHLQSSSSWEDGFSFIPTEWMDR